ncbi:LIC10906 family membrane protein [Leptospira kirschneri]|uniref:LIC10906 family membrane protein n=1 Tax=Leptospira kirschneri TaxID=29507 RepID=UPI003563B681
MSVFLILLTSSIIFVIGIYIKKIRNPLIRPRQNFFFLAVFVGLWTLLSGCRQFIPYSVRLYAPNWILITVIFVPYFLSHLVNNLTNVNYQTSFLRKIIEFCIISFLILSALSFNLIKIIDINTLAHEPKLAYHILILYSIIWISESIFKLAKCLIYSVGMVRVRFSLMLFGISIALLIIITLVWILPFYGIYLGSYIHIATLIWITFWGIAILHYDAFHTRREIFAGKRVPILSRMTLNPILKLYSVLDPFDYECSRIESNTHLTYDIIRTTVHWLVNRKIPVELTAHRIASRYDRYIK